MYEKHFKQACTYCSSAPCFLYKSRAVLKTNQSSTGQVFSLNQQHSNIHLYSSRFLPRQSIRQFSSGALSIIKTCIYIHMLCFSLRMPSGSTHQTPHTFDYNKRFVILWRTKSEWKEMWMHVILIWFNQPQPIAEDEDETIKFPRGEISLQF